MLRARDVATNAAIPRTRIFFILLNVKRRCCRCRNPQEAGTVWAIEGAEDTQLQIERDINGRGKRVAAMDGGGGGKNGCTTRSRRIRTTGRVPHVHRRPRAYMTVGELVREHLFFCRRRLPRRLDCLECTGPP